MQLLPGGVACQHSKRLGGPVKFFKDRKDEDL